MYAPIIVFAYNRPIHLKKVLFSLSKNTEAQDSDLYIFIDGPKGNNDVKLNIEVQEVAESFQEGYFKKVIITKNSTNKGLAANVIFGVSEVVNKYGRVIVTEDDSVCSEYYLQFMNSALDYYDNNRRIWSIGRYSVPLEIPEYYDKDVIKTQRCCSYAWAVWANRWNKVDWDILEYNCFFYNPFIRHRFNKWGSDRSLMLDSQMAGKINSWAIRFEYSMVKHGMYNIMPVYSYINTIGHDGTGTHGGNILDGQIDKFSVDLTKALPKCRLEDVKIDRKIRLAYNTFFDIPLKERIRRYLVFFFQKHEKLYAFLKIFKRTRR